MKILIGIPHYDMFRTEFVTSLLFLIKKTTAAMQLTMEMSPYIYKSRNRLFKEAQNCKADYLFMIDCDLDFPEDGLKKLIELNKDVCAGIYYKKEFPHLPLAYKWTGKEGDVQQNILDIPKEPFKIDSIGSGFMLISKRVLEEWTKDIYQRYNKPFTHISFNDGWGTDEYSEDTSFCLRCKDLGYEIWADPGIRLGHIGKNVAYSENWGLARQHLEENDGWTTEEELKFLSERANKARSIVEIGSWKGRSTKVLLQASEGVVHAVDHFRGSPTDRSGQYAKIIDVYKQFLENVGRYHNLKIHKMSSEEAVKNFEDGELDMVWIDGDHSYEACSKDIDMWLPKIKKGGLICGHDYEVCMSVKTAVDERFDNIGRAGSIWYKEVA